MSVPPAALRPARVVAGGLVAGALLALAVAWFIRMREPGAGVPLAGYLASLYALLSPFQASFMRAIKPVPPAEGNPPELVAAAYQARNILTLAPLEGAVMFCAVALIVGPHDWPLLAALVPLFAMLAWFPRG